MPYSLEFRQTECVLVVGVEGEVSARDTARLVQDLGPMVRELDLKGALLDLSTAESCPSSDEVRLLVSIVVRGSEPAPSRVAVVPGSTPALHGVARTTAAFAAMQNTDARVFSERGEALTWLQGNAPQPQ